MPVVLLGGHFMGVGDRVARDGVALATAAAAEYPGNGFPYNREEAVASVLAHETVESGIGQAVEGGQQQRQVVVVEYSWKSKITDKVVPTTTFSLCLSLCGPAELFCTQRTSDEAAVALQQSAHQQEDVIWGEAHQEDEDGAADQLPDPHLLIGLRAGAPAHGAEDAAVADLHTKKRRRSLRCVSSHLGTRSPRVHDLLCVTRNQATSPGTSMTLSSQSNMAAPIISVERK